VRAPGASLVVDEAADAAPDRAPAARARAGRAAPVEREAVREAVRETIEPELHLIGQRVEPALDALDDYLDRALRSSRAEVRIVHGHGTGRLRDAVRDHLRRHRGVSSFRAGAPDEGGNGATVVALRS
jgi:dsDNA-specific endonuclease/ATPase MutS2